MEKIRSLTGGSCQAITETVRELLSGEDEGRRDPGDAPAAFRRRSGEGLDGQEVRRGSGWRGAPRRRVHGQGGGLGGADGARPAVLSPELDFGDVPGHHLPRRDRLRVRKGMSISYV